MEGEGDPLSEGESNAAKPLLTRFCVAKSVTTLQTSLTLPELPCTATADSVCGDFPRSWNGGCRTGKFRSFGRWAFHGAASHSICGREIYGSQCVPFNRCGMAHGAFRPDHQLTFCHFYPVAERNGKPLPKSRWTGFGSEQPEIAARNTATLKIRTT